MISVIIPNFNRADALPETLASLLKQDASSTKIEFIVVDDGSTDQSIAIVNRFQKTHEQTIRLIEQDNRGPSVARNSGAIASTGDTLLFWDSDMIAEHQLLHQHIHVRSSSVRGMVAGARRFWPGAMTTPFSSIMNRSSLDKDQFWRQAPTFQDVFSSNFSIEKDLFWEIGGFDESLRAYEDIDFSYRAFSAGVELVFCREAIGYHNHAMTLEEACRQQEHYQKYAAVFIKKHPDLEGEIEALVDKAPIRWSADGYTLIQRKLFHQFLALQSVLVLTKRSAKILEQRSINERFMRRLYWSVLGAYQLRGYRAGLRSN